MKSTLRSFYCLIALSVSAAAAETGWIERSDRHSMLVLEAFGTFDPEWVSQLGLERFDPEVIDLKPGHVQRMDAALAGVLKRLSALRKAERDALVQQDLDILVDALERGRRTRTLEERLLVPYFDLPRHVFEGIQSLLDARNPDARRRTALERLTRYAGLSRGAAPIAELARARLMERTKVPNLRWPYRGQVEQHLRNCGRYIDGIAALFESGPVEGWEAPHERLAAQLRDHCAWVKAAVLPKARAEPMLPPEIYADRLRNVGVDLSPEQAIAMGMTAFAEVRDQMARLAANMARERKLASSDYREVLRELKREAVPPENVLALYRERLAAIEEIVTREQLVSLPQRAASIRLASEAESAAIPAPYFNAPRLVGNRGEAGEFILPLRNPNATDGRADDFTAPGPAWTLTAHEARPGHELQFAAMVERGVSLARAVFAFNSTNVEGWALYAESIMFPHFPPDGLLFGLQLRLLRAARAFLDPLVNLGRMTPAAAQEFLLREVALSEAMAQQEADRYAFAHPGQAVSYLYGYQRLRELRMKAELLAGTRFDQREFHDLVLAQGLLPPRLLEQSVLEELARRYPRQRP